MALALELTNLMELQRTSLQVLFEAYGAAYRESVQKAFDLFKEGLKATLCEVVLNVFGVEISPFIEEAGEDPILLEESLVEEFAEKGQKTAKADLEVDEYIQDEEEKQADVFEGLYGLNEFLQGTVGLLVLKCLQAGKGSQTVFNSLMEDFRKGEG